MKRKSQLKSSHPEIILAIKYSYPMCPKSAEFALEKISYLLQYLECLQDHMLTLHGNRRALSRTTLNENLQNCIEITVFYIA